MKTCSWCGDELEEGEAEPSSTDREGNPVCYDCYMDRFSFTCTNCENSEHINKQGAIGSLFVANDEDELGIPNGIYEVMERPFYADGAIEMYLYKYAVRYLCPNVSGIDPAPYPMGFICETCGNEIRAAAYQTEGVNHEV